MSTFQMIFHAPFKPHVTGRWITGAMFAAWLLTVLPVSSQASLLEISASQITGTSASSVVLDDTPPGGLPLPYGFGNRTDDVGWIWEPGDQFTISFSTPTAVNGLQVWSVYDAGVRGSRWDVLWSDDGVTFTHEASLFYILTAGGGHNDDGSLRNDYAGWYGFDFNATATPHLQWRVSNGEDLIQHSPRSGEVQFFGVPETRPLGPTVAAVTICVVGALWRNTRCKNLP